MNMNHTCEICDSSFTLKYEESTTECDPVYCPFCGEYLSDVPDEENYDDEDE